MGIRYTPTRVRVPFDTVLPHGSWILSEGTDGGRNGRCRPFRQPLLARTLTMSARRVPKRGFGRRLGTARFQPRAPGAEIVMVSSFPVLKLNHGGVGRDGYSLAHVSGLQGHVSVDVAALRQITSSAATRCSSFQSQNGLATLPRCPASNRCSNRRMLSRAGSRCAGNRCPCGARHRRTVGLRHFQATCCAARRRRFRD